MFILGTDVALNQNFGKEKRPCDKRASKVLIGQRFFFNFKRFSFLYKKKIKYSSFFLFLAGFLVRASLFCPEQHRMRQAMPTHTPNIEAKHGPLKRSAAAANGFRDGLAGQTE